MGSYKIDQLKEQIKPFLPPHDHDYAEIIYVENRTGIHLINNQKIKIKKGDLLFIRPEIDKHCFQEYDDGFSLLHIFFSVESLNHIKSRYIKKAEFFFNREQELPDIIKLNMFQQGWIETNFTRLLTCSDRSLFELERFLLNLISVITKSASGAETGSNIEWLNYAIKRIQEPQFFTQGVQGFVSLCNKSPEHVERELKKRTGKTITEFVTQARMSWAAYKLAFTDSEVLDIIYDCGFNSISHFYKIFKKYYMITPNQYRENYKNILD